jgi:hypothetical protein
LGLLQVGGYGVGFKAGSIALAQTAVVLTWKTKGDQRVLSIGVLSNEPFESRGEEPHRLFVSIDTTTDKPTSGSTDAEYDKVMRVIKQVNPRVHTSLCNWLGPAYGPHGTTVLLLGFRGLKEDTLFDFDSAPNDAILLSGDSSSRRLHSGNKSREKGDVVAMDSSLRAFLEIMFFPRPSNALKISLFDRDVRQRNPWDELKPDSREKQEIKWTCDGYDPLGT